MVTIKINIEKRHLFLLAAILTFLAGTIIVISYGNFRDGNPTIVGHSSDEINVNINGEVKTLQQAIENGDFNKGNGIKTAYFEFKIGGSNGDFATGPLGFEPKYAEVDCIIDKRGKYSISSAHIKGKAILDKDGNLKQVAYFIANSATRLESENTRSAKTLNQFIELDYDDCKGKIISWSAEGINISKITTRWGLPCDEVSCEMIVFGN